MKPVFGLFVLCMGLSVSFAQTNPLSQAMSVKKKLDEAGKVTEMGWGQSFGLKPNQTEELIHNALASAKAGIVQRDDHPYISFKEESENGDVDYFFASLSSEKQIEDEFCWNIAYDNVFSDNGTRKAAVVLEQLTDKGELCRMNNDNLPKSALSAVSKHGKIRGSVNTAKALARTGVSKQLDKKTALRMASANAKMLLSLDVLKFFTDRCSSRLEMDRFIMNRPENGKTYVDETLMRITGALPNVSVMKAVDVVKDGDFQDAYVTYVLDTKNIDKAVSVIAESSKDEKMVLLGKTLKSCLE